MLLMPLKMYYSTQVFHKEFNPNGNPPRYENVLCANVLSAEVDVFKIGLPDPFGAEFLYHYFYKGDPAAALANPSLENPEWNKYYLMCSLSDSNGWGHGNCRFFTPLSSYGDEYLEEE